MHPGNILARRCYFRPAGPGGSLLSRHFVFRLQLTTAHTQYIALRYYEAKLLASSTKDEIDTQLYRETMQNMQARRIQQPAYRAAAFFDALKSGYYPVPTQYITKSSGGGRK
jgi:hypothetical protein